MSSSARRFPSRLALIKVTASVTAPSSSRFPSPCLSSLCLASLCLPSLCLPPLGQVGAGEGGREQDLELDGPFGGVHEQVAAAGFEQQLAAAAAGQQRLSVTRDDGDGHQGSRGAGRGKGSEAGGVTRTDQAALRAHGQAVGSVLHAAAADGAPL